MKKVNKVLVQVVKCLILVSIVLFSLTGCGGSDMSSEAMDSRTEMSTYETDEEGYSDSAEITSEVEQDSSLSTNVKVDTSSSYNRKVIKTGNMTIQTKTFSKTIEELIEALKKSKGYVDSMEMTGVSYYASSSAAQNATLTVRIPQKEFDSFLNNGGQFGNVIDLSCNTEDITSQYVDTQRHLQVLETRYERLLELMKQVDNYDDIFKFEKEIAEVEYEINSYKGTLNNFDSVVDMSTITIYIEEVKEYTEAPIEVVTIGDKIHKRFLDSCKSVKMLLEDLLLFVIYFIPYLIILVPLALIIRWLLKIRKTRKTKKQREDLNQRRAQLQKEIELEQLEKQEENAELQKQKQTEDENKEEMISKEE